MSLFFSFNGRGFSCRDYILTLICWILQSIHAAGAFPVWIAIYKRGLCFPCDELHPSLDIPHSSDFWVSLAILCNLLPCFRISRICTFFLFMVVVRVNPDQKPKHLYVMMLLFRTEEVAFYRRDGQAKVLGILLCVSGATLMVLYKGPAVFGDSTPMSPLPGTTVSLGAFVSVLQGWEIDQWRLGAILLIADSFFCGAFVNLQVPDNPRHLGYH